MSTLKDLTGQRFGRLVVVRKAEDILISTPAWEVRCDCGEVKIVRAQHLKRGHSQSCGCLQRERTTEANLIDLTGRRFGKLVVQRLAGRARRAIHWECRCDCGGISVVRAGNLTRGNTKSCGCGRNRPAARGPRAKKDRK